MSKPTKNINTLIGYWLYSDRNYLSPFLWDFFLMNPYLLFLNLHFQRYSELSKQRLDHAILLFLRNFLKSYIGEQAMESSKVKFGTPALLKVEIVRTQKLIFPSFSGYI